MDVTSILVCDDHEFSRKGLIQSIKNNIESDALFYEATNGIEAVELFKKHLPNIVFLDVEMPEKNGIEVCKTLKSLNPSSIIIFITMHTEKAIYAAIKKAKANAYISKSETNIELRKCINFVTNNTTTFYSSIENIFLSDEEYIHYQHVQDGLNILTNTEKKVLKLILKGKNSSEIVDLLFITTKSLNNYRYRICKKLDLPPVNNSLKDWVYLNQTSLKIFFDI